MFSHQQSYLSKTNTITGTKEEGEKMYPSGLINSYMNRVEYTGGKVYREQQGRL